MVDTARVFQIENERAAEEERAMEEFLEYITLLSQQAGQSVTDYLNNYLVNGQFEPAVVCASPNLESHVVKVEN